NLGRSRHLYVTPVPDGGARARPGRFDLPPGLSEQVELPAGIEADAERRELRSRKAEARAVPAATGSRRYGDRMLTDAFVRDRTVGRHLGKGGRAGNALLRSGFADACGCSLDIKVPGNRSAHQLVELGIFKSGPPCRQIGIAQSRSGMRLGVCWIH